jgi:hypothetical protein
VRNYSLCAATQSLWVARCPVWVGHSCPTPLTLTLPLTGKARLHRPGKNSPLPPCHAERSRIVQRTILRSRSIPTAITKPDKNIHLKTTSSTLLRNAMSNRYGGTRPIPAAKRRHRKAGHGSAGKLKAESTESASADGTSSHAHSIGPEGAGPRLSISLPTPSLGTRYRVLGTSRIASITPAAGPPWLHDKFHGPPLHTLRLTLIISPASDYP